VGQTLFDLTTSWNSYSVEFTTANISGGSTGNARLRMWFKGLSGSGDVYWFDDFSLTEGACGGGSPTSTPPPTVPPTATSAVPTSTPPPTNTPVPGSSVKHYERVTYMFAGQPALV
jgi:hypothetical protein